MTISEVSNEVIHANTEETHDPDQCHDCQSHHFIHDNHAYDQELTTFVRAYPKIGRNEVCPCGSGKKYKKCCSNS